MINILMTTARMPINGISNVIMQYLRNLDKQKFQVDILTSTIDNGYKNEIIQRNSQLILWKERETNQITYFYKLLELLKNNEYDVIHNHGNSATMAVEMLAAKIAGVPVRIVHSHNTTCQHKYFDKLLRPVLYGCSTHRLACGDDAGRWLYGKRTFSVVNNGIDLSKFDYDSDERKRIRNECGIDNSYVIGHIGRFTYQKNHEFLLNVFDKVAKQRDDVVLLLVGIGPLFESVQSLVKRMGLEKRVIFYGATNKPASLYSAFDVFAFPSRFEGLPFVLVETQANGLPSIISDKVTNEVICTSFSKKISLDKIEDWVSSITNFESFLEERKGNGERAIEKLNDLGYSISSVIDWLENYYREAVERTSL